MTSKVLGVFATTGLGLEPGDPFVIRQFPPRNEERAGAIAEARQRHADREFAAWMLGSDYHRREAQRAWNWAEFLSGRPIEEFREAPRNTSWHPDPARRA